ncbi:MAG: type I-E CRISPR-associated protein Cas5/CasD, partial [Gammaproteobacteria bacterium]
GVQSAGKLLRDYHTAQVPGRAALKGRPHATRRDELTVPKDDLNTILSTRDYRQDAACLVAIQPHGDAPYSLKALADKLHKPQFVLYLGRKSCPPAVPLYPQVITADSVRGAFDDYIARIEVRREEQKDRKGRLPLEPVSQVARMMWGDGVAAGVSPDLSTPRKDRLIRRRGWQFGDRIEHVALMQTGD